MRRIAAVAGIVILAAYPAPARSQDADAVEVAVVVPVGAPPLYGPDGRPDPEVEERVSSIAATLRALVALAPRMPLALAPSPVLCDELRALGETGEPALAALRGAAAGLPVLSSPYADARLASLPPDEAGEEIATGRERLEACIEAPPVRTLYTPDLSVDRDVLEDAAGVGASFVLAPIERVRRRPLLVGGTTLLPAAEVVPGTAPNDAYLLFAGAERAVAVVRPGRPDLVTFLTALADDPRVVLRTLAEVAERPVPGRVFFAEAPDPPAAYRAALGRARAGVDQLGTFTLAGNPLHTVLSTWIARARSSAEWDAEWDVGRERAERVGAVVRRQMRLVGVSGGSVTFTSRRGSIPVTLTNEADYPVRVRVALESSKLEFPDGPSRIVTVEPPGDTVLFEALARSTGTFLVSAAATSPDGGIRFGSVEITARSTAANIAALALTGGGAVFLAFWYLRLLARRRRSGGTA